MSGIREALEDEEFYFQQDGPPPHYHRNVRPFLDEVLPNRWIRQRGFIEYPPRSPHLTPLDLFYWNTQKTVYAMKPAKFAELRVAIERECMPIPRGLFCDVCDSIAL